MDHVHLFLEKQNFQEIGTDKEGRERVSENPELFYREDAYVRPPNGILPLH